MKLKNIARQIFRFVRMLPELILGFNNLSSKLKGSTTNIFILVDGDQNI